MIRAQVPPHPDTSRGQIDAPGASYALVSSSVDLEALIEASRLGESGAPMLDVALALVAGGWPVFPCGQDKAPLVGGGFKARECDTEKVRHWWAAHPDAMPGICPGDQGLAALDVDSTAAAAAVDAAGYWNDGFVVATGGTSQPFEYDGAIHSPMHIYVRATEQPKIPGVVVRFRGGYVIAPGARRGNRVYTVCDNATPRDWTAVAPASAPVAPQRAELLERVGVAVACIPNTETTDREQYVAVAHMVKGAVGEAGHDIFMAWAAKYPGAVDPAEDARVFETITAPRTGWPELWRFASLHGFDASPEIAADARNDFTEPAPVVEVVDTRTKLTRMLTTVHDAKDAIDRSLALKNLRKAGFVNSEIKAMLSDLAPTQSDEGNTLGELLQMPELLKEPTPAIPYLVWPGLKTLVAAREKIGKSTLAMAGAARATRGETFLGEPMTPQRVLWLSEEPLAIAVMRAHAMGADLERFIIVSMGMNPHTQLKRALDRWAPSVVVIDTLFRFAAVEDENDSVAWMPTLLLFDEVTRGGAGLLTLVHSIKHSEKGEYRGSSAIGGFVDAILEMHLPKNGGNVRQLSGRGRLHFGKPFAVRLLEEAKGDFELLGDANMQDTIVLGQAVCDYVADNPGASQAQIRAALKKKTETISALLGTLKDTGKLTQYEGSKGWHLKSAQKSAQDDFKGDA